ncbi:MAG: exodeoxyribonuclease VII small subunit [Spirochaetia bacterium]|nr:exodeoxyribonuclease VII small subunit [Spirochaetia bacterium]MDD5776689.1 exodeoxyribonuclease VII small subunit [Treponema sp.]MCI6827547.1 exodeoxyribonuclease VII small subunit [Spirochaetia bacterium]MCI7564549.1 exodeoxyribonuclease VII small subunit [Spirochaetia bacterium]MCI7798311.1 exodeoxyribonuclease VII small subunit [Spirochaetia bacterium]
MKNFEEKLEKLEYLTNNIKRPDISLEEALKNFEEGIKLAKTLEKQIDEIEGKIQILANNPSLENNEEPEITLFSETDEKTGSSGSPEAGTRQ